LKTIKIVADRIYDFKVLYGGLRFVLIEKHLVLQRDQFAELAYLVLYLFLGECVLHRVKWVCLWLFEGRSLILDEWIKSIRLFHNQSSCKSYWVHSWLVDMLR
jgi:hypothetical protein